MSDRDDKILEELKGLRTDVSGMKTDISALKEGQKAMQGDISSLKAGQKSLQDTEDRRGKLLTGIADIASTILQEQHAQRTDIRSLHDQSHSLHDELHATKDELKSEILTSRAEAKRDTIDLKAAVVRKLKNHEQRIDELEDAAGIPHPDEN